MHLAGCQTSGLARDGLLSDDRLKTCQRYCCYHRFTPLHPSLNCWMMRKVKLRKKKQVHATKRAPIGAGKCGKAQEDHAAVEARRIQIEIRTSKATN